MMLRPLLVALCLLACAPEPPEQEGLPPLETEVVEPPPEAAIDPSLDAQAPQRQAAGLAGAVPSDFPSDFPLYRPATVIDFGESAAGRRTLALRTPDPPAAVRSHLEAELVALGWTREGDRWSSGGRTVTMRIEPLPGGSRIDLEY